MRRLAMALVFVAMAVTGCKQKVLSPCEGKSCSPYRPQTSPGAVLHDFGLAYENHDAEAADTYAALLAPSFVFKYFDPQSSTPSLPVYWGAPQESLTTRGLLTDPSVSRLALVFPLADTASAIASTAPGDPPGTLKIDINGVDLQVQRGDILYQTHGTATFYIAPFSGVWRIVRWEDGTAPPAAAPGRVHPTAVLPATWGAIKAMYFR